MRLPISVLLLHSKIKEYILKPTKEEIEEMKKEFNEWNDVNLSDKNF